MVLGAGCEAVVSPWPNRLFLCGTRCSLWLSDRSRKDAGTQRGECGMDPNHENLRPLTHFPSPARGEGGKNGCGVLGKGYSVFSVVRFGSKPGGMIDGASIDVL